MELSKKDFLEPKPFVVLNRAGKVVGQYKTLGEAKTKVLRSGLCKYTYHKLDQEQLLYPIKVLERSWAKVKEVESKIHGLTFKGDRTHVLEPFYSARQKSFLVLEKKKGEKGKKVRARLDISEIPSLEEIETFFVGGGLEDLLVLD